MSALIALAPLCSVAMAQGKTSPSKIEQQASPQKKIKKRQWRKGGKYDGGGAAVTDYGRHKLKTPRKGQRWVRDGNDFVLVTTATGVIASIVSAAGD
jgi:Ni/Co efflux regulator RcnB